MAEGNELAVAYVSLAVSGQGLRGEVDKALGQATKGAGEKQGRGLGNRVASGFKKAAGGGFLAAGALAGGALAKGFGRLRSLDDARGKLEGLGHSTKTVDGIMKNALGSVKGTAFGLDEAASTAAGTVAAGIKPGKELQKTLSLVADSATIAGTDMGSMGAIFNKVAASNKIQGDVIAQLGDQGIPIIQFLSKELGVSAEQVTELASKGKIDFKTFQSAMESGLGGAAQKSGETFSGAFKNMGAAAGRVGASLLSGLFPQMQGGFSGLTDLLDKMGPVAEDWGKKIGDAVRVVAGYVGDFVSDFKNGEGAAGSLRSGMEGLFGFIKNTAIPAVKNLVGWLVDNKETLIALGGAVLAGVVAFKAFMIIKKVITFIKLARAAMAAFNLTMLANPIGLIVLAIAALVGGLIWLYRNNDKAREIMQAAWKKIKEAVAVAVDWIKTVAWPILKQVFSAIGEVVKWLWSSVIKPYVGFMWNYWKLVFGFLKTWVWPVVKDVFSKIATIAKWLWQNAIKPAFNFIWSTAKSVFGWIKTTGWPWVKTALSAIGTAARDLWNNWIKPYFNNVKNIAMTVFGWIKNTGWPWIRSALQSIGDKAKWLWGKVKESFDKIKGGVDAVKKAFGKARDGISEIWSTLVEKVRGPINKVMDFLRKYFVNPLNSMLEKIGVDFRISLPGGGSTPMGRSTRGGDAKYAAGGVLPGYSPGRDNMHWVGPHGRLSLSGGEAIMRPEWTRAVGSGWVNSMNSLARRGGVGAVRNALGFARGGIIDHLKAGSSAVIGATPLGLMNPDNLRAAAKKLLNGIGSSMWAQTAKGAAEKVISKVVEKVKGLFSSPDAQTGVTSAAAGSRGIGGGWQALWSIVKGAFPGAVLTSSYRPGSITSTGNLSYHAQGRAIDVSPSMAIFNYMLKNFGANLKELIYSPAGGRQIKNGRSFYYGEPVRGDHWDHVHIAAARGGVVPMRPAVFDNGGTLAPGLNMVHNKLGRPEPLVRADQVGIDHDRLVRDMARVLAPAVREGAYAGTAQRERDNLAGASAHPRGRSRI